MVEPLLQHTLRAPVGQLGCFLGKFRAFRTRLRKEVEARVAYAGIKLESGIFKLGFFLVCSIRDGRELYASRYLPLSLLPVNSILFDSLAQLGLCMFASKQSRVKRVIERRLL
jgi:hypothetical protein